MTAYLTIEEAAHELRKTPRWLAEWLRKTPADSTGRLFFCPAGRVKIFTADDVARIRERIVDDAAKMRPLPPAHRRDGQIYFIEVDGFIKIGWAIDAHMRINQLQVGSPHKIEVLAVALGSLADERALHKRFSVRHERGEWFRTSRALRREIRAMRNHPLTRVLHERRKGLRS